jgi:hypothetical protein
MFEWPRFAAHLCGQGSAEDRLTSPLSKLAEPLASEPDAREVLTALFDEEALVNALQPYAVRLHHVGFLAPPRLAVATVEALVAASSFRERRRTFKSAVLAKDLSARLGRDVNVAVVNGRASSRTVRCPEVEVFVADLPPAELDAIVNQEMGSHVALEVAASASFESILDLLHAHHCWELPLMRRGPLTNREINSRVLHVDVGRQGHTRRLEFIACAAP